MKTEIKLFFKRNKEGMMIGSIVGAISYFVWKGFVPKQMSILSDTLSGAKGLIDIISPSLDLKIFLLFIIIGFSVGMAVDMVYKPNK